MLQPVLESSFARVADAGRCLTQSEEKIGDEANSKRRNVQLSRLLDLLDKHRRDFSRRSMTSRGERRRSDGTNCSRSPRYLFWRSAACNNNNNDSKETDSVERVICRVEAGEERAAPLPIYEKNQPARLAPSTIFSRTIDSYTREQRMSFTRRLHRLLPFLLLSIAKATAWTSRLYTSLRRLLMR